MTTQETPDHYRIWRLEGPDACFEIHLGRKGSDKESLATDGFIVARSIAYSLKEPETNICLDLTVILCKKTGNRTSTPPPQQPEASTCAQVARDLINGEGIPNEEATIDEVATKLRLIGNTLFASPHTHPTKEDRLKEMNSSLHAILQAESRQAGLSVDQ